MTDERNANEGIDIESVLSEDMKELLEEVNDKAPLETKIMATLSEIEGVKTKTWTMNKEIKMKVDRDRQRYSRKTKAASGSAVTGELTLTRGKLLFRIIRS